MRLQGFEAKVSEESCVSEETQTFGDAQFLKILMFLEGFRLSTIQTPRRSESCVSTSKAAV